MAMAGDVVLIVCGASCLLAFSVDADVLTVAVCWNTQILAPAQQIFD
jgi:hypothetical protein